MAVSSAKVTGEIRLTINCSTSKWKCGYLEVVEKNKELLLVVHYKCGTITNTFQVMYSMNRGHDRWLISHRPKLDYAVVCKCATRMGVEWNGVFVFVFGAAIVRQRLGPRIL